MKSSQPVGEDKYAFVHLLKEFLYSLFHALPINSIHKPLISNKLNSHFLCNHIQLILHTQSVAGNGSCDGWMKSRTIVISLQLSRLLFIEFSCCLTTGFKISIAKVRKKMVGQKDLHVFFRKWQNDKMTIRFRPHLHNWGRIEIVLVIIYLYNINIIYIIYVKSISPPSTPQEHFRAKRPKTLLSFCHFVTI